MPRTRSLLAATFGVALGGLLMAAPVAAQSPLQIAIVPPLQIVPEDEAVKGLRLALYGKNTEMTGLDYGLVHHTTGKFTGLQLGLVGLNEGGTEGVQWNLVTINEGVLVGVQLGLINTTTSGEGMQWGGFNHSTDFRGLQVALVNYAETLDGLQVGLINIIREGGFLPVFPFFNFSFD